MQISMQFAKIEQTIVTEQVAESENGRRLGELHEEKTSWGCSPFFSFPLDMHFKSLANKTFGLAQFDCEGQVIDWYFKHMAWKNRVDKCHLASTENK